VTSPLSVSLAGRDLLRIGDLVPAEAETILDRAVELRAEPKQPLLAGATLGLTRCVNSSQRNGGETGAPGFGRTE